MLKYPVVLIAFEEFDNLGVRYLASSLKENRCDSRIIDFRIGEEEILKIITIAKPLLVGFSIIYQYYIYRFSELISYLRSSGINCHFTAGGHYASLRYEELFQFIPHLDSIVMFEGEKTLVELYNCLSTGEKWQNIQGLAYRNGIDIISNPLRKPENDLDNLPFPIRSPLLEYALGKKFTPIIAGRGCVNNCSFCSTKEYFKKSSGPIKRLRNPEKVVMEMCQLHSKNDCSVFLFQDDDFPVKTGKGSDWIGTFCSEIGRNNMIDKIIWKINCRPDEIDNDSFLLMKKHGLYLVFLGLDDGTDSGLARLNKQMTVRKSLEGINILKKLEIGFDYGFMLFQPSSTFSSINENLDFLNKICGDGYTPVTFLKLMPYFETGIERELKDQGRLTGKPGFYDYKFIEDSLNLYYEYTRDCFREWFTDQDGLLNLSRWIRNYLLVFNYFYGKTPESETISQKARNIISESNLFLLDNYKELASIFESGKYISIDNDNLDSFREKINTMHNQYKDRIDILISNLLRFVEYKNLFKLIQQKK